MAWDAMGLEEVQNQLNDAEKYDISAIDILLHFWKSASGEMMVKVTGLHGLGVARNDIFSLILEMLWSKTGYFGLLGNKHSLYIILLYLIER